MAALFYAMLPDIDGRQRLQVETDAKGDENDQCRRPSSPAGTTFGSSSSTIIGRPHRPTRPPRRPTSELEAEGRAETYEQFVQAAEGISERERRRHRRVFRRAGAVRERQGIPSNQTAPFQKKRRWDRMMELRGEADGWISNWIELEAQESAYKDALYDLLDERADEARPGAGQLEPAPLEPDGADQLRRDLRADGDRACLMLGFCTRLAALGGAAFMCFVVMTQPAFPASIRPIRPWSATPCWSTRTSSRCWPCWYRHHAGGTLGRPGFLPLPPDRSIRFCTAQNVRREQ